MSRLDELRKKYGVANEEEAKRIAERYARPSTARSETAQDDAARLGMTANSSVLEAASRAVPDVLQAAEDRAQERANEIGREYARLKQFEATGRGDVSGSQFKSSVEAEAAMKAAQAQADRLAGSRYKTGFADELDRVRGEADFLDTAKQVRESTAAAAIPFWQGNLGAREIVRSIQLGDMSKVAPQWGRMTKDEENILLYYAGKGQWDEADEYLDYIENAVNQREMAAQKSKMAAFSEEHPVIGSALSVPAGVFGGMAGTVDLAAQNARRMLSDDPANAVDYSSEGQRLGELAEQLRAPVREDIEKNTDLVIPESAPLVGGRNVASLLYDTGLSGAESLLAGGVTKGAKAGGFLLAGNAAGSTARDIAERGGTDDQALVGGLAAGAFEWLFESVSLGNLKAMKEVPVSGIKDVVLNVAKSAGVNASEEMATEAANILFDTLAMGDISNWQLSIENYMAQGMSESEAKQRTASEMIGQVLEAGISGGIMGIGFGGLGSASSAVANRGQYPKNGTRTAQEGRLAPDMELPAETSDGTQTPARVAGNGIAESQQTQSPAFGENGQRVAAEIARETGQSAEEVTRQMETAYEAGRQGVAIPATGFATQTQERAFIAGRQDHITDLGQNKSAPLAEDAGEAYTGVNEGGIADGERAIHLREGGQWADSAYPGGQVSPVEAGTGRDQSRETEGRPADSGTASLTYGEEIAVNSLGIEGGSQTEKIRMVTGGETASMKAARDVARERGLRVFFFAGNNLHINKGGKMVSARAYITGDRVFIRVDHSQFTADQLMRHEAGHDMINKGEINPNDVRDRIARTIGKDRMDELAAKYVEAYAEANMTEDEVWVEIICDSLGDMNIFSELEQEGDAFELLNAAKPAAEETRTERSRGPPSSEGKFSREVGVKSSITPADIQSVQSVGRKSVNAFTQREIAKTESFARKYWKEMGVKSPFFRAWFGDWRVADTTPVEVASVSRGTPFKAGKAVNDDTGRTISWGAQLKGETKNHQRSGGIATDVVGDIKPIVENAVLLDSHVSVPDSKQKMPQTAFMHRFYALVNDGTGTTLMKLYAEEALSSSGETFTRAYELKDIKKVATLPDSVHSQKGGLTDGNIATDYSVADLFALVKQYDAEFNPKPASKAVNEDGTPKAYYHGTLAKNLHEFKKEYVGSRYAFDEAGFFFIDRESIAEDYAHSEFDSTKYGEVVPAYLDMKNPLVFDAKYARANGYGNVFKDEDAIGVWDVYQSAILEEFEDGGHDGIILDDGESQMAVVFEPTQIKSATDNVGTFDGSNPDIRFSQEPTNRRSLTTEEQGALDSVQAAARAAVREELDRLGKQYGWIKAGEDPAREVQVPRRTSDDKKVSQTARTILEAKATPDEALPDIEKMVADGTFSYEVYGDKQAISDAEDYIRKEGWGSAQRKWFDEVKKGQVSKRSTTVGWMLYNNAVNSGDTELALDVLNHMVEHQRNAAQAVQATRILKKLSPETQLYGVVRSVERLQQDLNDRYGSKNGPELTIDQSLAEQLLTARTDEQRAKVMRDIYKDIGKQMPSRFIDKWNAWRYLAMLGNPRTHVRNLLGNVGFTPVVAVKNLTATAIEAAAYRVSGGRTGRSKGAVGLSKADRDLYAAAYKDFAEVQEAALGGGKYSDMANANRYIEEGRRVFGRTEQAKTAVGRAMSGTVGRAVEAGRKGNSSLLDMEDMWFSRPHYTAAMAGYCKANGITAEQIATGKGLEKARAYAVKEAQKATYRDVNAFSTLVSGLGRSGMRDSSNPFARGMGTVIEGILPFRKTPANILARGVEYSPAGLLKGMFWDLPRAVYGAKTGNAVKNQKSAVEIIDEISAGLTGSGLLALGVLLASQGLIRGHGGDDEEKKQFEEMMGHQSYSMEAGGLSVTLDWLAPECLPFFVGVNLWEATGGGEDPATLSDLLNATKTVTEPLLEMSCLQSLNDVFDAVGYATSDGLDGLPAALASSTTSYLTQALPTLLGQFERTGQDVRMTTFTQKDNPYLTTDMQYTLGQASSRLPGWDFQQIPYIDAWGRTESTGGAGARAANNMLNPAYTSTIETSKMEAELLRLFDETGEASVFPGRAAKSVTVSGEDKYLTAEEYVKYAQTKGQTAYKILTDLTGSAEYKRLSDGEKVEAVGKVYEYANAVAKKGVSKYKPDGWLEKAMKTTKEESIPMDEYILLYLRKGDIVSLKDKEGKTIANSTGLQIMEMLYQTSGLSDKQRQALFQDFGVGQEVIHYNQALVAEKLAAMREKAR